MGIDLLDISYRLEDEFEVKLRENLFSLLPKHPPPDDHYIGDSKVGELYDLLLAKIKSQRSEVPEMAWERFQSIVCDVLDATPEEVHREAFFARDLRIEG